MQQKDLMLLNQKDQGVNMAKQKGLYANINARKKAGTSRPKSESTITKKAYKNMQAGFPNSKKNKGKA